MPVRLFYIYDASSKEDRRMCMELETQLYALNRDEYHTTKWQMPVLGTELRDERSRLLNQADIILLLLSPDCLASEQSYAEVEKALERGKAGAIVIPILLRPIVSLESVPFEDLNPVPARQPISFYKNRDRAWLQVTLRVRDAIRAVEGRRSPSAKGPPQDPPQGSLQGFKISADEAATEVLQADTRTRECVEPVIGQLIGHYQLMRPIGSGGMSTVYLARHRYIRREAAIKFMVPWFADQKNIRQYFLSEGIAANLVSHPGLIDIYDYGETSDGSPYIIMEYLNGELLADRIGKQGKLSSSAALPLFHQIALAMAAVHEKGIIHRDLKTSSFMIQPPVKGLPGERIKVFDFNISLLPPELREIHESPGTVVGTPAYMAPESFQGLYGLPSDVYSLGVSIYEALAGRPPFISTGELVDLMAKSMREDPPLLSELVSGIPKRVIDLVHSMLVKDPDQRPSMEQVAESIEQILATDKKRSTSWWR